MKKIKYLLVVMAVMGSVASYGQKFHLSGTLQNMHLWRGLQVADGGVLAADVNVGFLNDGLKVGLWGGTDFTGDYKEFDYYVSYSVAGFTFAVWDIFNYSPELPFSKDIFSCHGEDFCFYTFINGFGMLDKGGYSVYDNEGNRILVEEPGGSASEERIAKGKALLQTLYDDLGSR